MQGDENMNSILIEPKLGQLICDCKIMEYNERSLPGPCSSL
jgi:hypothetical protein